MGALPLIYNLDLPALTSLLQGWGQPAYRAAQIWEGLYRQLWNTPEQFSSLPKSLRQQLAASLAFSNLQPVDSLTSRDGETVKTLFRIPGGDPPASLAIEAVLMRYSRRRTLCISSQAGCAMGCTFCATGQMGFRRHLTSGEIVEQVLYYARFLSSENESVTNIVIMGMGEPFHNYDATLQAIDRLNHPQGFNFGERRFTISTVGIVPMIRRFTQERRQVNLAVSLHAADDALRATLLPVNRKYPLNELFSACRDYIQATHRRLTLEWALIQGINDSPEQARRLAQRLQSLRTSPQSSPLVHVNVIPLNPTHQYAGQPSPRQAALAFQAELQQHHIPCTIRLRRGIEIQAGCGQLATDSVIQ